MIHSHALSAARRAQSALAASIANRLGALARRAERAFAEAGDRSRLERLDDATLRDIGLSRAEIGSVVAEAYGRVERSRRRLDMLRLGSG
jgi:uncharacterized protein YjiS (DUF1127 family)